MRRQIYIDILKEMKDIFNIPDNYFKLESVIRDINNNKKLSIIDAIKAITKRESTKEQEDTTFDYKATPVSGIDLFFEWNKEFQNSKEFIR